MPSASRVAPVDPGEVPPTSAPPQSRVYGRATAAPQPADTPPQDVGPFGDRPQQSGPFGDRPQESGPFGDRPRDDSPFGDRQGDRSQQGGAPQQAGPFGDRPHETGPFGDRPGETGPFGDRPRETGPFGERPNETAPFGSRPHDGGPFGDRPHAAGPQAAGAFGDRPGDADQQRDPGGRADGDRSGANPFGSPSAFAPPYAPHQVDHPGSPAVPGQPGLPGDAPQSPARATARASASARVAPPTDPDQQRGGPPYGDFGPPAQPPGGYSPEHYGELTTDIAGRGRPDQPSPDGELLMGAFPGATNRATVTPPSPNDTTSWPGPGEQGRFDQFKPGAEPSAKPETPHVRMLPILVMVVVGALVLLGLVFGIVYMVAGGTKDKAFTVNTGDCVKQDGTAAVKAACGDAGAFQVVSIVNDKTDCEDAKQPYVVNPTGDGKNQVLCLKPQA